MAYTPFGPWNPNAPPPVNKTFLDALEAYLQSIQYVHILTTPFHLVTNAVINAGAVNTYTATGGSTGVPTGATAVLAFVFMSGTNVGNWARFAPKGQSNTVGYPTVGNITTTGSAGTINAFFTLPVDSNGQIDIHVSPSSGSVTIDLYLYGYISN